MPICNENKDTTEHALECQTLEKVHRIKGNILNQWSKEAKVWIQNKEKMKQ